MKLAVSAILILALAGCSAGGPPEAANTTAGAADNVVASNTVVAAPTPAPSVAPATPAVFPAAYRGRWGINANDCDPARDDNKGLITISADGIKFYESRATVSTLSISSPTRIMADLAFSGEGQTWQSRTVFDLADGGTKLTRAEETPAAAYLYNKCPA